jgi:hypothetical protein
MFFITVQLTVNTAYSVHLHAAGKICSTTELPCKRTLQNFHASNFASDRYVFCSEVAP